MNARTTTRERLKEQKQAFVQEEILRIATKQFAARGFRTVTIDDIAAELGFTKSVIYYYLHSKNELLWEIFTRIFDTYFESIREIADRPTEADDKLVGILRQHAMNVMTHSDWTAIYHREEGQLAERQQRQIVRKKREYDAIVEDVYREGVEQGIFRDIPPHIAVSALLGSCNWLYTWYNPSGSLSAEEIADHYAALLANGFRTRENANAESRPAGRSQRVAKST